MKAFNNGHCARVSNSLNKKWFIMNNIKNVSDSTSKNALEVICDQHIDKLSDANKKILALLDWKTVLNLSGASKRLYNLWKEIKSYSMPRIENHIDLRLFANLQKCLASNFKTPIFINKAATLMQRFYEAPQRGIKNGQFGCAFPLAPEILYYAMFLAKNETVLEIAGASGENAALLAFSEAKRVYMNDINSAEVQAFRDLSNEFPSQVQEKIEPILGNCFELLKLKPELKGAVGLLLCNNLIHFFKDKELDDFLKLLKTILKPGGRAIFTANASLTTLLNLKSCMSVILKIQSGKIYIVYCPILIKKAPYQTRSLLLSGQPILVM